MATYILRDIPVGLWTAVKDRSHRQGWPVRPLLLDLLQQYADGRISPSGPPQRPDNVPSSEASKAIHLFNFDKMKGEAQRLITSPAKYLDPRLAEEPTSGQHLYDRFHDELAALEEEGLVYHGVLPESRPWALEASRLRTRGPGDSLDRETLKALIQDADVIIDGLMRPK